VVTDVVMPRLGGMGLAQAVRARRPDLPVLFTSGYADQAVTSDSALDWGELLRKPYPLDALARRVRVLIDRPGYPAEAIASR
jgi:DNA-binding response OmpR family regulator